jgi:rfaE bifunctional protein nucleotidyltransferase chain/domain
MIFSSLDTLMHAVEVWKSEGKSIVFTNGVFDILHIGHVDYLTKAKALGDVLLIGINSDASVKSLGKGDNRPINPEQARAALIDALKAADGVIVFQENTPLKLIEAIVPNVLVKGGDYDPNENSVLSKRYMVGSDVVKAAGGKVVAIPLVEGFSTTSIISKISTGK